MTKQECATRIAARLAETGFILTKQTDDSGKRVAGKTVAGFWCVRGGPVFYYGISDDLEEAQQIRSVIKAALVFIGATETVGD